MTKEFEVTLPKLGESIMNATIVQWFKKEGEFVGKDEPLLEVATDKVNSEIPSPVAGIVKQIFAHPDQELNVGEPLALIAQEGAAPAPSKVEKIEIEAKVAENDEMKDYYSPALLRIARENNVTFEELQKLSGTGSGGRISKKDLEDYIEKKKKTCPLAIPAEEEIQHVKMSGLRKAIAENMVKSFYQAPHATLISEVDVTLLMKLIKMEKDPFFEKFGVKLTITSFIARAITRALSSYSLLNATLQNDTIIIKRFINLGLAVNVEQGVMVPVIKGIHKMRLHEIAKAVAGFASKARTNTLVPDDVKEGTITMTNFGMTGVQIGIPIIRYPEVSIIGIGGISKKVVALEEDLIGIRQMMHVSLTFDHRVIDGMYGCGFLGDLKRHLEEDVQID